MNGPLVSVIINNFNYGRYLQDAIESALKQTYPWKEIVVVDDGSTDNSREIIEAFASAGKIIPVYKENGGQASAFNAGFARSRGEIIIFLDADDVLLPQAIEEVVKVWHKGVTKVQWRLALVDQNLKPLNRAYPDLKYKLPSGDMRRLLLQWRLYPSPPTSGNAFSRSFLQEILPMPEQPWRISADSYLLTLAGLKGPIASIDSILGFYRLHGENHWASATINLERLEREIKIDQNQAKVILDLSQKMGWRTLFPFGHSHGYKMELLAKLLGSRIVSKSRLRLCLEGIVATITWPYLSLSRKVRQILLFLLISIMPSKLALKAAIWGYHPNYRPNWLQRIVDLLGGTK